MASIYVRRAAPGRFMRGKAGHKVLTCPSCQLNTITELLYLQYYVHGKARSIYGIACLACKRETLSAWKAAGYTLVNQASGVVEEVWNDV